MSKATYSAGEMLRWLWQEYLRRHIGLLCVALVFMILEGSMMGALAYLVQPMFDDVFVEGQTSMLYVVGAMVVAIFLTRAFASVTQRVLLTRVAAKTAAAVRFDILSQSMKQDGAFHQSHPPGYLIQRVQTDVNQINAVWRAVITGAGRDAIGLVVLLGVAISVDPIWALLACVGIPVAVMPAILAQRFIRRRAREARDLDASLATRLDEVFHGIVQIKLNSAEQYQAQQYKGTTKLFIRSQVRTALGSSGIPAMVDVLSGVGFMTVILYGGSEIIAGEKTIGQFMSFFTAMALAFEPMRRLASISGQWQIAAASIERLKEIIDTPVLLTSPAAPKPAPTGVPEIVLKDVSLDYGDTNVLTDVNFAARSGQTTALVGASGAGKSTIFNILTRLVDPSSGQALIGGVATKDMALPDLRDLFSVVTQEALLFDETLRENILMGRENVTDEQLKTVLDAANVSDFLPKLSDGLDSPVGPRGSLLSGGQRQRVVIARALLRDTPILLLDEATSALDAKSEKVVQDALDTLASGRTTLIIAHRLSTVRGADNIIVMDRGRVVDQGTHEELLERGGIYANLYQLQFEDGKTVSDDRPLGPNALTADASAPPAGLFQRALRALFR